MANFPIGSIVVNLGSNLCVVLAPVDPLRGLLVESYSTATGRAYGGKYFADPAKCVLVGFSPKKGGK